MIFYLLTNTNTMSGFPSAADILHILSPLNGRTYENLLSWFPETDELDFHVGLLEIAWEDDDKLWYPRSTVTKFTGSPVDGYRRYRAEARMRYILDHAPDEITSVGGKWDGVGMRYVVDDVVEKPEVTAPTSPRSSQKAQTQADQPQVELPIDTPEAGPDPHVESESESESESDDAPAPVVPAVPERAVRCSGQTRKGKRCMIRSRQRLPQDAQWDCGRH
jgi:hypothetical protein